MDGLVLKINDDFLNNLSKRGLKTKSLKICFLIRDVNRKSRKYISYKNVSDYNGIVSPVLNNNRYLCSAGDFPVIENLELQNTNLNFVNDYQWFNITGNRYLVKKIDYDSFRTAFYESEIERYEKLMKSLIEQYISNINNAIDVRLNSYVDPCYVDAGYVSPNSDPII